MAARLCAPLAPTFPLLKTLWLLFMGGLKIKLQNKSSHSEGLTNDIRRETATVSTQELHRVTNNFFRSCFSAFGQSGNIFSICCITGGCLLDLLLSSQRIVFSLPSPTANTSGTRNMT